MAHRKKSRGRKRKYSVYARKTQRPSVRGRRRRRAKQGLLFDGGSGKATLTGMLRTAGGAAIGGAVARLTNKFIGGRPVAFILTSLAESYLATKFLKSPAMAAGIIGAAAFSLAENIPLLNDGMSPYRYADENLLNDLPMYLDENGQEMIQGDDGEFYYLNDGNPYALAQGNFNEVYPGYVNPGFYGQ
jgi:hypothetical protein